MNRIRSPRSRAIAAHGWWRFQQCRGDFPEPLDAIGCGEEGSIAAHGVQNQALVGFQHIADMAGVVHRELQAEFIEPHAGTGTLAIERQRQFCRIGQIEGQMIRSLLSDTGARGKHALRRFAKGNRNDSLPLGEAFAGTQKKRHTGPAPVVDGAFQCNKGLGIRVRGDTLFRPVADVLAAHHVFRLDRQHAAKHFVFFFTDGRGLQRRRRLHGHEAEDLE